MSESLRGALRERLSFWSVLQWVGLLAVLWYLLNPSPVQFATTVVSMGLFGLSELASDVYDLRESVRQSGFGIYALVGGTALLMYGDEGVWLPAAFLLVGAWFVLDGVQTVRHEGATESEPSGRDVYHDYVGRQVVAALEEGPRTRRELSEALVADDDAIAAAVAKLERRAVLTRDGSAVRLTESDSEGMGARAAGTLGWFARRVARPLTLELEPDEGVTESATSLARSNPDDSTDSTGDDVASDSERGESAGRGDGRDRQRERESAD